MTMKSRRFMILAATLVALNTFFWLAGGGLALPKSIINNFFGSRMVRAEVIVQAPGGAQDWRIDRGVITAVAGGNVTLMEADGTSVVVPVGASTRIQGLARINSVAKLRPRVRVVLYHEANQPADLVQVEGVGG
jgi:hypothetical protein